MQVADVLGAAALGALVGSVGCLFQLHRVAPEVSPVRDAVSDYSAGVHASWYRAQVVLVGLAAVALWAGLRAADLDLEGSTWLLVFALSRVLISGFPVDLPGARRSTTGVIHNLLAAGAFTSIAVASATLGDGLGATSAWAFDAGWYRVWSWFVAGAAVALAIAWLVPALRRNVFGVIERCWYVATITWLSVTAIGLLFS